MAQKFGHWIKSHYVARIYCGCGWQWSPDRLKGKTDLDLEEELLMKFRDHIIEKS